MSAPAGGRSGGASGGGDSPPPDVTRIDPEFVTRFAQSLEALWPHEDRDGPLGLAVSGGPDSMAMLLLAHAHMPGEIAVASVDHGLRPESAGEVAMVENVCAALDIPFHAIRVTLFRGNRQAMARDARYRGLGMWANEIGCGALATAHTADDQAETLLMRLVRGSGLSGLAGVRAWGEVPGTELPLVRPLLWARKSELAGICAAAGVIPADDPTNADLAYDRVQMRQHLADNPWLDVDALASSAQHLAEGWRALEWYAQLDWEEMAECEDETGPDGPVWRYYANVPRVIQIETVRRIVAQLGGQVTRSEAGRAADRLWRGENASLGGVLAVADIEKVERIGVEMRVWRFRPEPPRMVH